MQVAFTATGDNLDSDLDRSFGRTKYFLLVDTETGAFEVHDNAQILNIPQGAGIQAGQNVQKMGAQAVVTGNVGPNAFAVLSSADIRLFLADRMTVAAALEEFKVGRLTEAKDATVAGDGV